jgi:hypothetical protein
MKINKIQRYITFPLQLLTNLWCMGQATKRQASTSLDDFISALIRGRFGRGQRGLLLAKVDEEFLGF